MKSPALFLPAFLLLSAASAFAQWQTTTYSLKGGWNAIHLSGDATYQPLETLLPTEVLEVWRWNPNPEQVQFTESPLIPSAGTPEWSVWKRGDAANSSLSLLSGQASYLVKCSGTASNSYSVPILQSPRPPSNKWVRSGANLMGFPAFQSGGSSPLMGSYFASFPIATAANTRIFKYVGGDLGAGNPLQIFSPASERLDRTKAYWFSADVVGNFYAPLEVSLSTEEGLTFGRSGSIVSARIRNRTSAPMSVTFSPVSSEAAPLGQQGITGPVPLTRRSFNTGAVQWEETPITGAFQEVIAPQTTIEVSFGIDRASMADEPADAYFASFLRLTDSGGLMDIYLPSSATKSSLAGLWIGDITLNQVSNASTATGNTPASFPLRTLLHVADDGTASLLSKVFIGKLAAGAHDLGICTEESLLDSSSLATAQRLVAAHMPLDRVLSSGSGSVALGDTLTRTIQIPFNDPTNPFVHQYHPDHDNKNARGQAVGAGVESYNVTRTCTFTFTASPLPGSQPSGWGSNTIGGTYEETITGLHRNPTTLTGTFELRRANELGTLHLP
ncbi:hypothetical protein [Luteolibacter luteus]|uniref:Uncharacterized protein n=1 Tax=Luteolibacter luteus TaxID=2728835 RepID=A0A858RIA2_9BACT|nr:hypothetical protein [Luteolibacter luteus]QJE96926.1 hypothetical protein HHL09_14400 [Luteolibacter luteus]